MSPNPPFEKLEQQLTARGVSRAYAARYAQELRDHHEDLLAELTANEISNAESHAQTRLGDLPALTQAAIKAYQQRTFLGRHAWLFFGILPLFSVPVIMLLLVIAVVLPLSAIGVFANGVPPQWQWAVSTVIILLAYIYPSLAGMAYYRAIRRRALGWPWRIIACIAPIAWGAWFRYNFTVSSPDRLHGSFTIGMQNKPMLSQGLCVLAAISLYAWFLETRSRRMPSLTTTP